MTLRLLETTHGSYFVCCTTPFHGQKCPECHKVYDDPMSEINKVEEPVEEAGESTTPAPEPPAPPVDPEPPTPPADQDAPDTNKAPEKPKRQRQPKN